jgi:hypothetical protein
MPVYSVARLLYGSALVTGLLLTGVQAGAVDDNDLLNAAANTGEWLS